MRHNRKRPRRAEKSWGRKVPARHESLQMSASENGCTKKQAMTYRPSTCTRGDRKVATDPPKFGGPEGQFWRGTPSTRQKAPSPQHPAKSTAGKGAERGPKKLVVKKQYTKSKIYGSVTALEKAHAYRLGYVQGNREAMRNPYEFRANSRGGPMLAGMWEAGRADAANGVPMRQV